VAQAVGNGCSVPFLFHATGVPQHRFKSPFTNRPAVEFHSVALLLHTTFVSAAAVWQRKLYRPAKSGLNIVLKSIFSGLSC